MATVALPERRQRKIEERKSLALRVRRPAPFQLAPLGSSLRKRVLTFWIHATFRKTRL